MNQCRANEAAFRQMNDFIEKTYPRGRFLAISGGKIIAGAVNFEGLNSLLLKMGNNSPEVLVVLVPQITQHFYMKLAR